MALSLREKQTQCIVRMLNLNNPVTTSEDTADEEVYKVLIYDKFCLDILSPLIHVKDLRKHGITLYFMIDKERQTVPDVPAVYFVQPTEKNVHRIIQDASRGVYESFHLNFSSSLPRALLENLAEGVLKSNCVDRIAKVYDQYMEFVTLEKGLFSLAHPLTYVQLNDPNAQDKDIEAIIDRIVSGLFSVVATLGVVPVIRCPRGGPAEMVASALDSRLRDHLSRKNNLFTEAGSLSNPYQRPLLCIFDRNFELSAAVQHDFSYRPLVHDVLGMRLNKVTIHGDSKSKGGVKSYELDDSDSFWVANGYDTFPKVAEEVETQLGRYKQDVEEVNRRTGGKKDIDFDGLELIGNTKHLMNAVNSLPELTERKKIIDKHTNILTALLGEIKGRALDAYCTTEEDMLAKGGADKNALLAVLKGNGTKIDKLRLAIIYLLASENNSPAEVESVEAVLKELEVDLSAFYYVKKMKSLNLTLAASASGGSKNNIVDWAEKLYGQSLTAVTMGVKSLLSGGRQHAMTRVVESFMEARPNPEIETYLAFDPRAPRSSSGVANQHKGTFKEAIVFMIGGGNYIEYKSLQELAHRQQPPRNIIYGTTELLTGEEFVEQLKDLGQKSGFGPRPSVST